MSRTPKPKQTVVEVDTNQHLNWPSAFKRDLEDMLSRRVAMHMIITHAFNKYALVLHRYDLSHYRGIFKQRLKVRNEKPHHKEPKPVVSLKPINLPDTPEDSAYSYRWQPPREDKPTMLTVQSDQCRWIEDDLPAGDRHASRCCGKPVHRQSYCKAHARRAFPPLTPEQRREILRKDSRVTPTGY